MSTYQEKHKNYYQRNKAELNRKTNERQKAQRAELYQLRDENIKLKSILENLVAENKMLRSAGGA